MSGREFSKVSPAVWRSARFADLSDRGKIAFLYFATNTHVTSAGCYVLPDGYACADLGWTLDTYQAIRAEVASAGMIDFDGDMILVERWFRHNAPMNDKHAKGTAALIAEIESDRLREKTADAFNEADQQRMERQAAKATERATEQSRREIASLTRSSGDRLTNTRFMRGMAG